MSIYTTQSLREETMADWANIVREVPKESFKLKPPKVEVEKAAEVYEAARGSYSDLIILGGPKIREDQKLINNFGTLATEPQGNQKKVRAFMASVEQTDENAKPTKNQTPAKAHKTAKQKLDQHVHEGAVINESNWWPYRNDAMIMGAIHGGRSFHIAGKKGEIPSDDLIWDAAEKRPRVLGRELIMLQVAGYQCIDAPAVLGIVLAPPTDGPRLLTLTQFRKAINAVKSVEEIKKIFGVKYTNNCAREVVKKKLLKV